MSTIDAVDTVDGGLDVPEWIRRVAEDERKRDDLRRAAQGASDRRAELVRLHGRRLVDELRATVIRDVETFRHELGADRSHEIAVEAGASDGGFVVRRSSAPVVSLVVTPRLSAAALSAHYRFTPADDLPPREHRIELAFTGSEGENLRLRHQDTGAVFVSADALSELLLTPVFTGRRS